MIIYISPFDAFILNLAVCCALASWFVVCFLSYYFVKLMKRVKRLEEKLKN